MPRFVAKRLAVPAGRIASVTRRRADGVDAALHRAVAAPHEQQVDARLDELAPPASARPALGDLAPERIVDPVVGERGPQRAETVAELLLRVRDHADRGHDASSRGGRGPASCTVLIALGLRRRDAAPRREQREQQRAARRAGRSRARRWGGACPGTGGRRPRGRAAATATIHTNARIVAGGQATRDDGEPDVERRAPPPCGPTGSSRSAGRRRAGAPSGGAVDDQRGGQEHAELERQREREEADLPPVPADGEHDAATRRPPGSRRSTRGRSRTGSPCPGSASAPDEPPADAPVVPAHAVGQQDVGEQQAEPDDHVRRHRVPHRPTRQARQDRPVARMPGRRSSRRGFPRPARTSDRGDLPSSLPPPAAVTDELRPRTRALGTPSLRRAANAGNASARAPPLERAETRSPESDAATE